MRALEGMLPRWESKTEPGGGLQALCISSWTRTSFCDREFGLHGELDAGGPGSAGSFPMDRLSTNQSQRSPCRETHTLLMLLIVI